LVGFAEFFTELGQSDSLEDFSCHFFEASTLSLDVKAIDHLVDRFLFLLLCFLKLSIEHIFVFSEQFILIFHVRGDLKSVEDILGFEEQHSLEV